MIENENSNECTGKTEVIYCSLLEKGYIDNSNMDVPPEFLEYNKDYEKYLQSFEQNQN